VHIRVISRHAVYSVLRRKKVPCIETAAGDRDWSALPLDLHVTAAACMEGGPLHHLPMLPSMPSAVPRCGTPPPDVQRGDALFMSTNASFRVMTSPTRSALSLPPPGARLACQRRRGSQSVRPYLTSTPSPATGPRSRRWSTSRAASWTYASGGRMYTIDHGQRRTLLQGLKRFPAAQRVRGSDR
jgi:hypothetical protein